ncbi:HlyD family efflux transporter periplasmic adaptor subunit [Actinoplanes sp. KI2]|uniref:efflux RND transporter periplasmic adaptor subunit n=1 Tax=Actinoplanes sp. KI2 TaxID=2983315 RepID=UPI0021D5E93E|nr:HlyD family efflux transporter periplasmic adaptor subunit [Actinoplanes sp. KI2]MCU7724044.1 HlyD family efflux transporter periplasmic adaptor subunit [Actinoplanes sp. KI2]
MPARFNLRHPSTAVNAALVVAIAGGGLWTYESLSGPSTNNAANASVRTVSVQTGTVTKTVTADGTVESARTASASFVTGGTITAINVKVGQVVKKGQVLAEVDPADAQRSLKAAEVDRDSANDALSRAEDAGSDTSSAETEVESAEQAVDDAQAAVDGTVLTAPMTGTVTAVNGTLGSSVSGTGSSSSSGAGNQSSSSSSSSSSGFVEIADLSRLQVSADFAEADATQLNEKQAATITWNALSGATATGKVVAVDPSATTSNNVVTYGVTLSIDKSPAGARVGQTVSVSVTTGSVANATYVNSAAITTAGNQRTVTVVTNGAQETRTVQIGLEGDSATQITSGVQAGEQVLLTTTSTSTGNNTGQFPGGGGLGSGLTGGGPPGGGAGR